jgi:hypothetical protein
MLIRRSMVCAVALLVLAACTSKSDRSETAYCTAVGANLEQLNSPVIATANDIEVTITMYRRVARAAPLAIEPEWEVIVGNLETAATVNAADPASVQLAADTAREAQPAATRISTYTAARCGLQIGAPVATTTPSASTLAPDTTDG